MPNAGSRRRGRRGISRHARISGSGACARSARRLDAGERRRCRSAAPNARCGSLSRSPTASSRITCADRARRASRSRWGSIRCWRMIRFGLRQLTLTRRRGGRTCILFASCQARRGDRRGTTLRRQERLSPRPSQRRALARRGLLRPAVSCGRRPFRSRQCHRPHRASSAEEGLTDSKVLQKSISVVFPTDNGKGIVHNVRCREERRIRPGGWDDLESLRRSETRKRGAL